MLTDELIPYLQRFPATEVVLREEDEDHAIDRIEMVMPSDPIVLDDKTKAAAELLHGKLKVRLVAKS